MAVAWMPLAWLADPQLRFGLIGSGWLAALRGHWACLFWAVSRNRPWRSLFPGGSSLWFWSTAPGRIQLIASTAAGCVLGIALAAVQFIPTAQLSQHSVAKYRAGWLGTGGGLYWESLVSLVLPNHYDLFDIHTFNGPGDITFLYLYCSIAGLALALMAPSLCGRTSYVAALGMMLLVGMLWMLGDKTPIMASNVSAVARDS